VGIRIGLAALVVGVAVAGCSSADPAPGPLPSAATSAPPQTSSSPSIPPTTATTAPTPTPPPQPAAATTDSPTGAQSFARYWLATLDYAYKTGDTKPFLALGRCKSCQSLADGIDEFYSAGGRFEAGTFTVEDAQTSRYVRSSAAFVDLVYSRATGQAIPASGSPRTVAAERNVEFLLTLARSSQRWQVAVVKTVNRR
jgi:hypothetical protein